MDSLGRTPTVCQHVPGTQEQCAGIVQLQQRYQNAGHILVILVLLYLQKNPIIDYVSRLFNVRRSSKCSICGSVCCGRY